MFFSNTIFEKDIHLPSFTQNEPVFKRAIVAAAFSPRLHAVMNEAHRLLKLLGTWPIIVHVGDESPSARSRLEEEIDRTEFKHHPPICLVRSGNPTDVLVEAAKEYQADLIVAGALGKEGVFKYYLGSVARSLARHAPCSVLLFTEPHVKPEPLDRIHCAVEYDEEARLAIKVAADIAFLGNAKDLYFTHSFKVPDGQDKKHMPDDTEVIKEIYRNADEQLTKYLQDFEFWGKSYQCRSLYEKNRAVTLSFAREIQASLFVVPGPSNRMGLWDRLFPHDLELALQDLPCSILITKNPKT